MKKSFNILALILALLLILTGCVAKLNSGSQETGDVVREEEVIQEETSQDEESSQPEDPWTKPND